MEQQSSLHRIPQADDPTLRAGKSGSERLRQLDGWRAISILSVMSAHMLPLGPVAWNINGYLAALGMTLFFNLSGFLIVSILLRDPNVPRFLLRRVARIVPAAWIVLILAAIGFGLTRGELLANLFFYANIPPFWLRDTGHFWSLCVEMQFYVGIALAVGLAGGRILYAVPLLALVGTALRIYEGKAVSIVTPLRIDEILVGGIVALALHHYGRERLAQATRFIPFLLPAMLFPFTVVDRLTVLCYARPYVSALMIGLTLLRPVPLLDRVLVSRPLGWVASISYAIYLIHPYLHHGWFTAGDAVTKLVKRMVAIVLVFLAAILSTRFVETPVNRWAHRVSRRFGSVG